MVNEFHSNEGAIPISIFFLLFFESVRIPVQCLATSFRETSKSKFKSPVKIVRIVGIRNYIPFKGKVGTSVWNVGFVLNLKREEHRCREISIIIHEG